MAERAQMDCTEWVRREWDRNSSRHCWVPTKSPLTSPGRACIFSNTSSFTRLSSVIQLRLVFANHAGSIPVTSLGMDLGPPFWLQKVCWGFLGKVAFFLNRHTLEGWPSSLPGRHQVWIQHVERLQARCWPYRGEQTKKMDRPGFFRRPNSSTDQSWKSPTTLLRVFFLLCKMIHLLTV